MAIEKTWKDTIFFLPDYEEWHESVKLESQSRSRCIHFNYFDKTGRTVWKHSWWNRSNRPKLGLYLDEFWGCILILIFQYSFTAEIAPGIQLKILRGKTIGSYKFFRSRHRFNLRGCLAN